MPTSEKVVFLTFIALILVSIIRYNYKRFYDFIKQLDQTVKIIFLFFMLLISCIIIIIASRSFFFEFSFDRECWERGNVKELYFYGQVKKKYIDSNNHGTQAIDVVKDDIINTVHFPYLKEGNLWEDIKINDSIRKDAGSLMFFLKTSAKWDTVVVNYKPCR